MPRPTQLRAPHIEDVDEGDDSEGESIGDVESKRGGLLDTIEGDSAVATSQGTEGAGSQAELYNRDDLEGVLDTVDLQDWSPKGREAKRRRVSISPAQSSSLAPSQDETSPARGHSSTPDDQPPSSQSPKHHDPDKTRLHQPIFHPAPRFKPTENDIIPLLPEAFSPQRRGAKYLPNGLAAQLQSWLSEVKGWEGTQDAESVLRIVVDDVNPGGHMYLVRARPNRSDEVKGYILAGEGKLTGLGRRAVVNVGSVVVIEEPVWEVNLAGELWTVGCNWSIG